MANPNRAIVSITGDGGFLFGVQELATAAQYRIGVVVCVFNNNAYGNVRRDQLTRYQGHLIGAELTNPDFVKLAESFGVDAYRVHSPDEFRTALEKALALDAPAVNEHPRSKLRGIEHPGSSSFRGKPRGIGPAEIEIVVERGSEASPSPFLHPYQ